jgi:hypothetical protein
MHKIVSIYIFKRLIINPIIIYIQLGIQTSLFEVRISSYSHLVPRIQYFTKFFIRILTALRVSVIKRRKLNNVLCNTIIFTGPNKNYSLRYSQPSAWLVMVQYTPCHLAQLQESIKQNLQVGVLLLTSPNKPCATLYTCSTYYVLMWQRLSRDCYLNLCLWMWCTPVSPHVCC